MRIISGKYKGRTIKMPKGIRPTQDKVRKALFDILGDIEGISFLELFAGSGAVGLEALSQGAREVVFVEKDRKCCKVIEENISYVSRLASYPVSQLNRQTGKPANRQTILKIGILEAILLLSHQQRKFDIIFLDPPYYQGAAKKTLQSLAAYDILAPAGLIVAQHFKKDNLPENLGVFSLFKQARYGDTILSFYRKFKG